MTRTRNSTKTTTEGSGRRLRGAAARAERGASRRSLGRSWRDGPLRRHGTGGPGLALLLAALLSAAGWAQDAPKSPPKTKRAPEAGEFELPERPGEAPGFDPARDRVDRTGEGEEGARELGVVADPRVRWAQVLEARPASGVVVGQAKALVGTAAGQVLAFHAGSGNLLWTGSAGAPVTGRPVLSTGEAFAGTSSGSVVAFDLASGARRAATAGGAPILVPLAAEGDWVTALDSAGQLLIYEREGLRLRRQVRVGGEAAVGPLISGEQAIVATRRGQVAAFDLATGAPRWSWTLVGEIRQPLLLAPGIPVLVLAGTTSGTVAALDAATGREVWRRTGDGAFQGAALGPADDRVLVAFGGPFAELLDLARGSPRQVIETGGAATAPPVQGAFGAAFFLRGGRVDLYSSALIRTGVVRLGGRFLGPAAAQSARVYVLLEQRILYCLEP